VLHGLLLCTHRHNSLLLVAVLFVVKKISVGRGVYSRDRRTIEDPAQSPNSWDLGVSQPHSHHSASHSSLPLLTGSSQTEGVTLSTLRLAILLQQTPFLCENAHHFLSRSLSIPLTPCVSPPPTNHHRSANSHLTVWPH
jgi:hypothetical protein